MLEQRDRDPPGGAEGLSGLAQREGLVERGELAHRPCRAVGQEDHLVRQPEQAAEPVGGGELLRPEPEGLEVVALRGGEGGDPQPSLELGDPCLRRSETGSGPVVPGRR